MTRPLRLEYPGALWHVHNRGVERRDIYLDDHDRVRFLELLESAISEYRWLLHAYVLMSNHFHLLVETIEPTLSRGMQTMTGDYAQTFNQRHGRVGHLFQGRFTSHLVEKETYFLELVRYIVLNPVRAKMVEAPGDWKWSNYPATAGLVAKPLWLETETTLNQFHSSDRAEACRSYRTFVAEGVGSTRSPWDDLIANVYLGSETFIARVAKLTGKEKWRDGHSVVQRRVGTATIGAVASHVEAVFGQSIRSRTWRSDAARLAFALLARREAIARWNDIGASLGVSPSGARAMCARAESGLAADRGFREQVESATLRISQCKVRS